MFSANGLYNEAGSRTFSNRPDTATLARLAAVAGLPIEDLEAISFGPPNPKEWLFRGRPFPAAVFKGHVSFRKACPACLRESPYHRAIWDLAFISTCPAHEALLINTCRDCGSLLRWRGHDLTRCPCSKGDLTFGPLEKLPVDSLEATSAVYGLLDDDRFVNAADQVRALPPFVGMRVEHIVEFMWRLGLGVVGERKKLFSLEHPGEAALTAHLALQAGLDASKDWPNGFFRALTLTCQRWGPSAELAPERLAKAVMRWLASLPPGSGTAVSRALFDRGLTPN